MGSLASLSDVGKRYVKYEDAPTLLTGMRQLAKRSRRGRLWAIRHLDLEVEPGDAIGVIGRNGSGKSTTLALLAGVTAPTEGIVRVRGRVAPLLRLGVGFHRELTGRENVYVNGSMLGMTTQDIDRRLDEIVEFAEVRDFIDTPIKFYSSGMLVRLGFASAVAAEPDLLLVDEVLAVGDIAFQSKSFERMMDLRANGTTIVVVSHNLTAIRQLADRALLLHDGEVRSFGPVDNAVAEYLELLSGAQDERSTHPDARIVRSAMTDARGTPTTDVAAGDVAILEMDVAFERDVDDAMFVVAIATESAQLVYAESSDARSYRAGATATIRAEIPIDLVGGTYVARIGLQWGAGQREKLFGPERPFTVNGRSLVRGVADLRAKLEIGESGSPPTT